MRYLVLILLLPVHVLAAENYVTEEIPHHIYIDNLDACPKCATHTIIISDDKKSQEIFSAFKSIAESFGQKHAGSIVNWATALKQYRFFKNHQCPSFTNLAKSVVVYIDKNKKYCKAMSYDNQDQLVALIFIISQNIGKLDAIRNMGWRYETKKALSTYAEENKVADSLKQAAYELVDYFGDMLLEKQ